MYDLLQSLRKSGVGCQVGGVFAGAVVYADDLLLLAPSRSAMQSMLCRVLCRVWLWLTQSVQPIRVSLRIISDFNLKDNV